MRWFLKPLWRHNRLQAVGSEWTYRAPQVGELVVRDATQTHPGVVRRIVNVRDDVRDGRPVWIIEHVALDAESTTSERKSAGFWAHVGWPRMDDHYPICGVCRDLMPCQHVVIDTIADHSGKTFDRYNTPGVCPSCCEPVTHRQRSITFDRNLYALGPVTFHLRKTCRPEANDYDRAVHHEDGRYELTCPGSARRGYDESGSPVTYCTESDCRGADRDHQGSGFWIAAYLPRPDGYHRSPEGGMP
ncbi:hypothetical protein SEA_EYRE_62 [Gordonia phage Eyre]|uniref:Uncharacterized protein n=1 Tax=Gordonia phage Eyre TaxID=1887646 RepID=A0A1B3B019_9CAUD|nr:hypothetical protein BIZ73_gp62 [Gordonia phage Eyre]AOE44342.1 hypothetical protein SEA_EYRE_62 [Gordonia phage Eyre]